MNWPDTLPDNCPPDDADLSFVTVYMLTSNPIGQDDFRSLRERNPNQQFDKLELEYQAHGLSVYEKIEHIKRTRQRVRRLRKCVISWAELQPEHGRTKPTPSKFGNSHRTWWVPLEVAPWTLFQIVVEDDYVAE